MSARNIANSSIMIFFFLVIIRRKRRRNVTEIFKSVNRAITLTEDNINFKPFLYQE
jgi:hypothetical protein